MHQMYCSMACRGAVSFLSTLWRQIASVAYVWAWRGLELQPEGWHLTTMRASRLGGLALARRAVLSAANELLSSGQAPACGTALRAAVLRLVHLAGGEP